MEKLTVFYDGSCPLCVQEISLLRRLDRRDRIIFENVAEPGAVESCPIDRERLPARFHVRLPDGRLVDGARAFTEAWARIPGLGVLRYLGRFGPSRKLLDFAYARFLRVRPALQTMARRRADF